MKFKLIPIFLLSVLSFTVVAQEKKTLLINEPQGGTPVIQNMLMSTLTSAATESTDYQPISKSDRLTALSMSDTVNLGKAPVAKLMLLTQIEDFGGALMITVRIVDIESRAIIKTVTEMLESDSDLELLRQQCSVISKKLFGVKQRELEKLD